MSSILSNEDFLNLYKELLEKYYNAADDILIPFDYWLDVEYELYLDNPIDYDQAFIGMYDEEI